MIPASFGMAEVLEIQESLTALGYDPGDHDGILGPRTLGAAVELAHSQGWFVSADKLAGGDVSPEFVADLLHLRVQLPELVVSARGIDRVGAWVWGNDLAGGAAAALDRAVRIGLSDVDLFVTPDGRGKWKTRTPASALVDLAFAYRDQDIAAHGTFWAYSSPDYLRQLRDYIDRLMAYGAIDSITLDTEHALSRAYRRNPGSVDDIADALRGVPVPVSVTGYGFATKADKALMVALRARGLAVRGLPQAYSVTYITRGGNRINMPPAYQPKTAQRNASRSWPPSDLMGLACYKQPDDPLDWIAGAFEAAQDMGATQVRYWDLANMRGAVAEVMIGLCAGAALRRKGVSP